MIGRLLVDAREEADMFEGGEGDRWIQGVGIMTGVGNDRCSDIEGEAQAWDLV